MKYLIVGLGNIGSEYVGTRHNIGFEVLDFLAKESNIFFSTQRLADVAYLKSKGRTLVLVKPSTYMNLSGKALVYWMSKENIPRENLLVVVDDLAIKFGSVRIRKSGSDAGHNGLKNIAELLGDANYNRLRFGIGADFPKGGQIDFVLGKWTKEEREGIDLHLQHSAKAILDFPFIGIDRVMNVYNK